MEKTRNSEIKSNFIPQPDPEPANEADDEIKHEDNEWGISLVGDDDENDDEKVQDGKKSSAARRD